MDIAFQTLSCPAWYLQKGKVYRSHDIIAGSSISVGSWSLSHGMAGLSDGCEVEDSLYFSLALSSAGMFVY